MPAHPILLCPGAPSSGILPAILLPLCSSTDAFPLGPRPPHPYADVEDPLPELQLLPETQRREPDHDILTTHLETLLLLTTTRAGRDVLRRAGVYPVLRLLHDEVEDDAVREADERVVGVLLRDEAPEEGEEGGEVVKEMDNMKGDGRKNRSDIGHGGDGDDDEKIEEIF